MAWIILLVAGLFEVGWAVGMKYTEGFTRLWPSLFTLGMMFVSFGLLSQAVRTLPIGTAYAVWTGIGVIGAATYGVVVLGEAFSLARFGFIALILVGIAGLKLVSDS